MPFESLELNLRRNRIPYFSLRDKQQEKRKIKNKLKQFNKLLNSMHLNFRKIEIDPFDGADDFELKINRNKIPQNKSAKIICQNLKDTGLISHRKILLSGDSFNITKTHVNALNFTFSLINDKDLSHKGFYILGIN